MQELNFDPILLFFAHFANMSDSGVFNVDRGFCWINWNETEQKVRAAEGKLDVYMK